MDPGFQEEGWKLDPQPLVSHQGSGVLLHMLGSNLYNMKLLAASRQDELRGSAERGRLVRSARSTNVMCQAISAWEPGARPQLGCSSRRGMTIHLVQGVGEGSTSLAAFDAALLEAGIANFN